MKSALFLLIVTLLYSCTPSPKELKCSFDRQAFLADIKNEFSADTVLLLSRVAKEEIYFPTLYCINVWIGYFDSVEVKQSAALNEEAITRERMRKYAEQIKGDCNIAEFDQLSFLFATTADGRFYKPVTGDYYFKQNVK